jgi:hypothetical protein
MRLNREVGGSLRSGHQQLSDHVKAECMQQLNFELLQRLKAAQEDIRMLKVLLERNGKEEVLSEGSPDIEEGSAEEQTIPEAEAQGKEAQED